MIAIDVKKPETCNECFACHQEYQALCYLTNENVEDYVWDNARPEWCPIIEIKETEARNA